MRSRSSTIAALGSDGYERPGLDNVISNVRGGIEDTSGSMAATPGKREAAVSEAVEPFVTRFFWRLAASISKRTWMSGVQSQT
jgi:hypothetical protein